jgi:hypothetical protein
MPKEKLLVYDVREGWDPLCEFLEIPVPDASYPNLNDSQSMKALYFGMMAFGLFYWVLCACAAVGFTYLAIYQRLESVFLGTW